MKHNKNHDHAPSVAAPLMLVRFEFTHPTARTVTVAGTFNDWHPTAKYCLVVDGQWMPDPLARETVPNPYGGRNSVLKVVDSKEAVHRANAANLPLKIANQPKPATL